MTGDTLLGLSFITLVAICAVGFRWFTVRNERAIKRKVEAERQEDEACRELYRKRVREQIEQTKARVFKMMEDNKRG